MKKCAIFIICLLFLLTGCSKSQETNKKDDLQAAETINKDNDFCLIQIDNNETEKTRKYFKYIKDENPDSECTHNYSHYYVGVDNLIKYGYPSYTEESDIKIENADLKTFQVLDENIAKDKNNIYLYGKIMDGILDTASFVVLNYSIYASDNKAVYKINDKINIIDGADPKTFKNIGSYYGTDKNYAYYYGEKIEGADSNSFKIKDIIGYYSDFGIDKSHIYYRGNLIEDADPNTFDKIDENYFKDKNFIYYKNGYYSNSVIATITGSDSSTFAFLDKDYSKDKNQVYFNGEIIEGADPETFEVEDGEYFAKDKNNLYVGAEKRDKKSVVKNFVEAFIKDEMDGANNNFLLDVNKKNEHLDIIVEFIDICEIPSWLVAEGDLENSYLPRAEGNKISDLENRLINNFNIKNISFFYKMCNSDPKEKRKTVKVFDNHKYIYNPEIGEVSPDGNIVNNYFDMTTGETIIFDGFTTDEEYQKCQQIRLDYDKTNQKYCDEYNKNLNDKIEKKYGVNKNFNPADTFLKDNFQIQNDVEINSVESPYPQNSKTDGELIWDGANKINIVFKHTFTNIKIIVKIIDEPKCILAPFGFSGNPLMKGLFYYYIDAGCVWQNLNLAIIPQNLLDQKLAELYNAVGMHYYDLKDYQIAISYFDKATSINKDYAQAIYNKACSQALLNDTDGALISLKRAIEIDSAKFKEKAKKDKDFNGLMNNSEFQELIK